MADTIQVEIVSAEASLFSGEADMVFVPAEQGEIGVAPQHTPLLTRLVPGEVRVVKGGEEQVFFVASGILEIQPSIVSVLSDVAERAADIDEKATEEAKRKAEETLEQRHEGEFDIARAQAELAEAIARLRVVQRIRERQRRGH
ncbi:MAG TPA: F0F1 ATP synthase subunit epsilon [Gammaproteobacteria bacterium]|nr:F0F1 ATP synthase subunit epsilon [Gammaproteobacteria bacterium]